MAEEAINIRTIHGSRGSEGENTSDLLNTLRQYRSGELVFAVVGYAGSGTSLVSHQLRAILEGYEKLTHTIKAREAIDNFARNTSKPLPSEVSNVLERITAYQNTGDALRNESGEYGAVAAYMVRRIREIRDGTGSADNIYILDSIKHPAEVDLLRHVYGKNFCLIGVGCRPDVRKTRLRRKLGVESMSQSGTVEDLIHRDAEDSMHNYGQQVNDAFHMADYFVDNTTSDESENELFTLPDRLKRLLEILCDGKIHRPEHDERGLFHANAAALRSSCLSRQVGAAILDPEGNLISVGANDVPRFGGGLYSDRDGDNDDRCFKKRKCCSNTQKQLETVKDIFEKLSGDAGRVGLLASGTTFEQFSSAIKSSRIRSLIEFSRSIHAEMDALLTLVRSGTMLPMGSTLYSTTYPCHNCARHIVAAGIARVVYLEPYSKSLAIDLHDDAIADNLSDKESEGKVRFLPYQGVSPRLFKLIFTKREELKDKEGRMLSHEQVAKNRSGLWTKSYKEFEEEVIKFIENNIEGGGAANEQSE